MSTIEVFADITCPFTHVGLTRWVQRRSELGRDDVHLRVRSWPLELVNGEPLAPDAVAHKVADLRDQVAPDLFEGFDAARFPTTTLPALRLTIAAYAEGDPVGEAVALELRSMLFEHGVDVSDPDVLSDLASRHGLTVPASPDAAGSPDPVVTDLEEGRARGVVGSPHFFGPGVDAFCPGLRIRPGTDHLEITASGRNFDEFVEACFADLPPG